MLWSEFYPWLKFIFLFSYSLSYNYTRKQRKLKFEPNMTRSQISKNQELYRLKTVTILFTFVVDYAKEHKEKGGGKGKLQLVY